MKQLKYVNSKGDVIDFREYSTQIYKGNFHSYEWGYDGTEQQLGSIVNRFTKESLKYEMVVAARGRKRTAENNLNLLTEITEYDVINKTPGKLWWGEYYLNCYVISGETEPSESFYGAERSMVIFAPYPLWIMETKKSFLKALSGDGTGNGWLDYDYDYNYDYAPENGSGWQWYVDHFAASEFEMTIYGPATNPHININGHAYQVYDDVEAGEYIEINSRDNTVVKYRANGSTANLYDMRGKEESVFAPIPGGMNIFTWSGAFGFDVTLFLERSEPKW